MDGDVAEVPFRRAGRRARLDFVDPQDWTSGVPRTTEEAVKLPMAPLL